MPDPSADRPLLLPEVPFTVEDIALVAKAIGADYWIPSDRSAAARSVLTALAAAGRLLPPDAERTEEWGIRMEWVQGPMDLNCQDRETAEDYISTLSPSHRGIAKLVRRVAGPWVEVSPDE